ncbi:MAG: NAD-dependent epimerase/dehydratase family protein [Candidatus Pacebacteria bacterium]|nr:NAD-dependent epimerase/dehydratase family protein [Candidatus Paceibacterota bacterium]
MSLILVTGGAGFIGSHLCERLKGAGHRVISLDNYFTGSRDNHVSGVEYREGHTKDIERLVPESPDLVFHLGEYSRTEKSFEDVETVWDLNTAGTFAVLEFVRRRGAKIVYAGSSTKFSDGGLGRDQSPYAWSKATNTELVKNYGDWFGIPYAITYFYNVYGPRERAGAFGTVIEIFRQSYLTGRPLGVVAPGTQVRNFTHVDDIVDGLILVGEKGTGDEFGLGNDASYSIKEVAEMFGTEVLMLPERPGNRQTSEVDTVRARALGWEAKRSLADYIQAFTSSTRPTEVKGNRVLVFSTTYAPIEGPAESALRELMASMPNLSFDVITTRYLKETQAKEAIAPNVTVYRAGTGTPFDKFLLPFLSGAYVRKLKKEHDYLFAWSVMASYGAAAALMHRGKTPLLVTLADQKLTWYTKLFLGLVMRGADQVHASTALQGKHVSSLEKRMKGNRSIGTGDTFANAIRFAYNTILLKTK